MKKIKNESPATNADVKAQLMWLKSLRWSVN